MLWSLNCKSNLSAPKLALNLRWLYEAYLTYFGHPFKGAGKALIIKATINNYAYDKAIYVKHSNGQGARAVVSPYWSQNDVTAMFQGNSSGKDLVTIIDQQVGPENNANFDIRLNMNGTNYSCSAILVGQ